MKMRVRYEGGEILKQIVAERFRGSLSGNKRIRQGIEGCKFANEMFVSGVARNRRCIICGALENISLPLWILWNESFTKYMFKKLRDATFNLLDLRKFILTQLNEFRYTHI